MNIEFVQYKDNNDNEQKLKFLSEYSDKNYAGQFISDIQHDEINILGKASKKSSKLENELIEYTSSYSDNLLELVGNFTEFQYNSKQEIDTKKETELFVVDVFSGKYQIKGFNNFFDCTSNENLKNIREKIDKYNQNSPTYIFSKKTNCDLLLNIYFKYIDSSFLQIPYDTDTVDSDIIEKELSETISDTSYNTLVNNFWKKLIYLVELILKKDETILQEDSFTIEIIEKAIDILKKFKFEFDDQGLKLISSDNNNSAIWAPTQFSLAQITDLYKIESKKYAKNPENQPKYSLKAVLPRKEPNERKNETVNLISTYLNISRIDLKTNILVLSICKFLGDTSHILMTFILLKVKKWLVKKYSTKNKTITLSDGKEILLEPLKINLQLSERPMMIRSCLLDKYIIDSFELNDSEDLNHLIIFMKHVELLKNKYNEINDKQEQLDFDEKEVEVEEEVEEQEEEVGEEIGKEEKIPKFCYMYSRDENYLLEKKKYKIKLMMEKIKEKKDIFREPSNEILKFIFSDQNIDEKLDDKYFNDNFKNSKDNCKFIEDIYNICCLYPINNLFENDDEKIIDGIINTVNKCVAITIQYRFSGAQSSRNKKPIAIKFHKQLNINNQLELKNILNKFKSLYEYNNLIKKYNYIFDDKIIDDLKNTKITNIIEKISKLNDNDEFNNVLAKNEINDQGIVFQIDFNKDNKGKTITNIINYVSKLSKKFKSTTTGGVIHESYDIINDNDIINDIIYTIYKNINIYLYFDYHSLKKLLIEKEFPNEKKKEIFDLVIKVLNEEYGFSYEDKILGEERSYEQVDDIYKNYYSNENNKTVQELFKQYIIFLLDLIEYNYILKLKTKKPHTTDGIKRRRRRRTVRKKTVRPRTEPTPYTKYGTKRRIKTVRPRTKPSPHTPDRTKRRKTSSRSILHTKKRKRLESISRTRASSRSILHTKKRKRLEPIIRTRARSILHTKKRKRLESISRARSLSRRKKHRSRPRYYRTVM